MAYVCFKCKRLIPGDVKCLFSHLRLAHNINSSSTYFQCWETGCRRTFSFIKSYRRHIKTEHEENQALAQPANQAANIFNAEELGQQVEGEHVADDEDDEWDELL